MSSQREGPESSTEAADEAGASSKWRVLGAGGVFSVVGAMENGSWAILLPTIADDFSVDISTVVWVLVAFALGMAGTALTAGKVGDIVGHRRVAIVGLTAEGAMIIAVVLMPSFWPVLAFRFLQGIARATGLNSMAALVVGGFPRESRGQVIGLRAGLSALGLMLGPIYAGLVAQQFGWRAAMVGIVFLYAVQLVLLIVLAKRKNPVEGGDKTWDLLRHLDWIGAFVFLIGMSALLFSARSFRGGDAWVYGLGLIGLSAIAFIAAVRFERRSAHPILNLGLFKSPAFSGAGAALISFSMAYGAVNFLFPFFTQRGLNWSLSLSGTVLVAFYFVQFWGSPLMGHVSDKLGPRRVQSAGIIVLVTGLLLASRLGDGAQPWQVVAVLLTLGVASSLFMPPNGKIIYAAVPSTALGTASAVGIVGRYIGQSLGAALGAALLLANEDRGTTAAFQSSMLTLALITGVGVSSALLIPALIMARRDWRARRAG